MNIFNKFASLSISMAMFITSLTSCSGSTQSASSTSADTTAATTAAPTVPTEESVFPDSTHVKLIGRTLAENGTLWLAQSASGIEFTFNGTHASVDLAGDSSAFGQTDSMARYAVYVNGKKTVDEMMDNYEKSIEIFTSDETENVTVKILKLSESANSTFGIKSLNVTSLGGISPTPEKDLKIEFIGDSITCAYGVDDEDRNHHFSTKTEDATKSYAFKTAEKLDADYSMVCYSGHGIISGYTDKAGKINSSSLVPPVYEQFAKTYGSSGSFFDEDTAWDFSAFVPDYIVVNLGTNDDSYTKGKQERIDEYISAYVDFLKMLRKDNPDSHIIGALGIMGDSLYSAVEKAYDQYTSETGDTNVSTFRLSVQDVNTNGVAADWHPTEKTHEIAAEELSGYISSLISGSTADAA